MKLLITVDLWNRAGEAETRMWVVDDSARLQEVLAAAALESYIAKPIDHVRIVNTREANAGEIKFTRELLAPVSDVTDPHVVPKLTCHKCRAQQARELGQVCVKCGSDEVWM